MGNNDIFAYCKPETRPVPLGGIKNIEYLIENILRNPGTRITDAEMHEFLFPDEADFYDFAARTCFHGVLQ